MKKVIIFLVVLAIFAVVGCCFADVMGMRHNNEEVVVNIPDGATSAGIAKILGDNGVIRFPILYRVMQKFDNTLVQKGEHSFNKSMSYAQVNEELAKIVDYDKGVTVVVPEGFEIRQIAAAVESAGLVSKDCPLYLPVSL